MEKTPNPEESKIEKTEVIEKLQSKGLQDPEVLELLTAWTIQQEQIVTEAGSGRPTIIFNIDRAELYVAAGDIDGALECLSHALAEARQEDEFDLQEIINSKINEINRE